MDLFPAWSKVKIKAERGLPTFMSRARQAAENLKPAAFDPRSVDIDNDGWHQEGTTARWFGVGSNNPLFKRIKKAFENLDGEDEETLMAAAKRAEDMWGAPDPLSSLLDADISWIGGWQTQYGRGAPISDVAIESAARAIRGRELLRERGKRLSDIPDADEVDVPETADAIEISKDIEESAKKAKSQVQEFDSATVDKIKSRKERDEKLRESAKDFVSEDALEAAKTFDPDEYESVSEDDNSERYSEWLNDYQSENPEPDYADYDNDDEYATAYEDWQTELDDAWKVFKSEDSDSESEIDIASLNQAVAELFDFEFETPDGKSYSVKLNEVMHDAGGDVSFTVDIFDSSGRLIGYASRTLDMKNKTVSHDILNINENHRGSGVSTVINARNELVYAALGIETIEVGARSSADGDMNGVTHWPKVGFDWSEESDRAEFLDKVKDALNDYYEALRKNPDEVPTIKVKKETKENGVVNVDFVDVPMFSSPQEAEQLSQMLLEAMSEDFDDPKRLTAAEFVNWYGAEAYFKKGTGTDATYKRTVGQETKGGRVRGEVQEKTSEMASPREAAEHLLPRISDKNEAKLGTFDENGFGVPQVVPVGNKGIKDLDGAVKFLDDGGDLADIPDELLHDSVMKIIERGESEDRFSTAGKAKGMNGMTMVLDKQTGKMIGFKSFTYEDEHLAEVLGAHFAERFGFANGTMRIASGPVDSVNNPTGSEKDSRIIALELVHNYLGDPVDVEGKPLAGFLSQVPTDDLVSISLLDFAIGNVDRHSGNFLLVYDENGMPRLAPIDHSFALGVPPESQGWPHLQQDPSLDTFEGWWTSFVGGRHNGMHNQVAERELEDVINSVRNSIETLKRVQEQREASRVVSDVVDSMPLESRSMDPLDLAVKRLDWLMSQKPEDIAEILKKPKEVIPERWDLS